MARERRHRVLVLAGDPERTAASDERGRAGRGSRAAPRRTPRRRRPARSCRARAASRSRRGARPASAAARPRGDSGTSSALATVDGTSSGSDNRSEADEDHTARELGQQLARRLDREPGLAGAPGAGQRQQPHLGPPRQRRDRRHLELAAQERRQRPGQVRRPRLARRRRGDRRVLLQHRPLERLQLRRRLDAELVEHAARLAVGLERVGLPPRAVEREDQLAANALAIRVRGGKATPAPGPRPRGGRGRAPPRAGPRAPPAALVQPAGLGARERGVDAVQRGPAPERERVSEQPRGRARVPASERLPALRRELLEPLEVELARLDPQAVAGPVRLDPVAAEQLAQPVHLHLERVRRLVRWRLAPERVHETIARDRPVGVQRQAGEQRPPVARRQRQRLAPVAGLDRSKQVNFHEKTP